MNSKEDSDKPFSEFCAISEVEKTFQGNIRWNIPNDEIKSYVDEGGKLINSRTFQIGSPLYCSFYFTIYPTYCRNLVNVCSSNTESNTQNTCVPVCITFLNACPNSTWIKTEIHFKAIDVHGTFSASGKELEKKLIILREMIFDPLLYCSSLEDFLRNNDSDFIIECSVKIRTRDIKYMFDKKKLCYVNSRNYDYTNKETFREELPTDVSITINDRIFETHKILLAQIPYFQELFDANEPQDHFELTDIDHEIFNSILTFLYSGNIPLLHFKLACELYVVASDLKIWDLKYLCSTYLGANLTESNVVIALKLSHEYNDPVLKSRCFEFIQESDVKTLTEKSVIL